jgi:hypothetical protein
MEKVQTETTQQEFSRKFDALIAEFLIKKDPNFKGILGVYVVVGSKDVGDLGRPFIIMQRASIGALKTSLDHFLNLVSLLINRGHGLLKKTSQ